jgi:hypothetical protein
MDPAFTVRKQKWHWTCERCDRIAMRYLAREARKISPHLSKEETTKMAEELCRELDNHVREILKSGQEDTPPPPPPIISEMIVPEQASVRELATLLGRKPHQIMIGLMEINVFARLDEKVGFDVISKLLREYGYIAKKAA